MDSITTALTYAALIVSSATICRWLWKYFSIRKLLSPIPGPTSPLFFGFPWHLRNLSDVGRFKVFNNTCEKFKNGITLFWIGTKPLVVIFDPEPIQTVLSSNTLISKGPAYNVLKPLLGDGLITSSGDLWFKHRRIITPAFHYNILENYAVSMQENVKILVECLEAEIRKDANASINILAFMTRYTLDTICKTAMGVDIDCQRKTNHEYPAAVYKFSELSIEKMYKFWLRWDFLYYRTPKGKEYSRILEILQSFTKKVILQKQSERKNKLLSQTKENEAHKPENQKRKAFLDLLLDESENIENSMTLDELCHEVNTFMFAGHDTLAATISWVLFALGNEPKVQDKVYEELKEVVGDATETATTSQLAQLKYLDRVVKEVTRFYPSVPFIRRCMDTDVVIGDYFVPKGTDLSVNIYMLHHNPKVWENPEKFDPDRFLPENINAKCPYAHIPFSAGPRNCIGQRFARLELKTALTVILQKWRVVSELKRSEMKLKGTVVLRPYDERINVYLKPRK